MFVSHTPLQKISPLITLVLLIYFSVHLFLEDVVDIVIRTDGKSNERDKYEFRIEELLKMLN